MHSAITLSNLVFGTLVAPQAELISSEHGHSLSSSGSKLRVHIARLDVSDEAAQVRGPHTEREIICMFAGFR